jgi:hypothetical protein
MGLHGLLQGQLYLLVNNVFNTENTECPDKRYPKTIYLGN